MARYTRRAYFPLPRVVAGQCALCGSFYGVVAPRRVCETTACLACGSRQCLSRGLGNGQCGVCYYGLLPGWSGWDHPCGYKDCPHRAVARVGRGRRAYVCRGHLLRRFPDFDARVQAVLARDWVHVEDNGRLVDPGLNSPDRGV